MKIWILLLLLSQSFPSYSTPKFLKISSTLDWNSDIIVVHPSATTLSSIATSMTGLRPLPFLLAIPHVVSWVLMQLETAFHDLPKSLATWFLVSCPCLMRPIISIFSESDNYPRFTILSCNVVCNKEEVKWIRCKVSELVLQECIREASKLPNMHHTPARK